MQDGQIRLNKVTREWVIYAPSRRKRPQDFQKISQARRSLAPLERKCPFCTDKEPWSETILLELPNKQQTSWQTRVVPNKFPALTPDENTQRFSEGIYIAMPRYGRHELFVESPEHDKNIATMSKDLAVSMSKKNLILLQS